MKKKNNDMILRQDALKIIKDFGKKAIDEGRHYIDAVDLLDVANYAMFRYMFPMPDEFFRPTDSSESAGTVGTPINMERW